MRKKVKIHKNNRIPKEFDLVVFFGESESLTREIITKHRQYAIDNDVEVRFGISCEFQGDNKKMNGIITNTFIIVKPTSCILSGYSDDGNDFIMSKPFDLLGDKERFQVVQSRTGRILEAFPTSFDAMTMLTDIEDNDSVQEGDYHVYDRVSEEVVV